MKHPRIEPFLPRFPDELGGMFVEDANIIYLMYPKYDGDLLEVLNHELMHCILYQFVDDNVSTKFDKIDGWGSGSVLLPQDIQKKPNNVFNEEHCCICADQFDVYRKYVYMYHDRYVCYRCGSRLTLHMR